LEEEQIFDTMVLSGRYVSINISARMRKTDIDFGFPIAGRNIVKNKVRVQIGSLEEVGACSTLMQCRSAWGGEVPQPYPGGRGSTQAPPPHPPHPFLGTSHL
jgi:hypothetical protein